MNLKNGMVFTPEHRFVKTGVKIENGAISSVGPLLSGEDVSGCYIIPAPFDTHIHGAGGRDFCEGETAALDAVSETLGRKGVLNFLATSMTLDEKRLSKAYETARDYEGPFARMAGINMEGPFICAKKRGAQQRRFIHRPDVEFFDRLNALCGNRVKTVTLAPEVEGADEFIAALSQRVCISLGHTAADYDTALAAYKAGARSATHLFNGMPPLAHRSPGVIGAARDAAPFVELISDGVHVHPCAVRAAFDMFRGRVCLISDGLACCGMPEGRYTLGGRTIVIKDGRASLLNGTLAGGCLTLFDNMVKAVSFGITLEEAVLSASENPARAARLFGEIGSIERGKRADLLVLNDSLEIKYIIKKGEIL